MGFRDLFLVSTPLFQDNVSRSVLLANHDDSHLILHRGIVASLIFTIWSLVSLDDNFLVWFVHPLHSILKHLNVVVVLMQYLLKLQDDFQLKIADVLTSLLSFLLVADTHEVDLG